jgi:hypothetical protein
MIGKTIDVVVTSVLQTTAGKMIFGRFIEAAATQAAQSGNAPAEGEPVRRARPQVPSPATAGGK